jgi:hypothetical protein
MTRNAEYLEYQRAWSKRNYAENKEAERARHEEWRKANREKRYYGANATGGRK